MALNQSCLQYPSAPSTPTLSLAMWFTLANETPANIIQARTTTCALEPAFLGPWDHHAGWSPWMSVHESLLELNTQLFQVFIGRGVLILFEVVWTLAIVSTYQLHGERIPNENRHWLTQELTAASWMSPGKTSRTAVNPKNYREIRCCFKCFMVVCYGCSEALDHDSHGELPLLPLWCPGNWGL